jgi:hypothetical protein
MMDKNSGDVMKKKKLFTFALVFVGFIALCGVAAIESQLSNLSANLVAPPTKSSEPLETMGDAPKDKTAFDTTREASFSTELPAPKGCTIDQETLESWLNNLNVIFNNAVTIASLMQGVSDNPHTVKFPDITALLQNNVMPQDISRTCKSLQERINYLAQLTTALAKNMYTAIPTNML